MKGKILLVVGLGVGYVLGTRAGREKYDKMKAATSAFWNDPRVKAQVDNVEEFVREKAPEVSEFISDSAKKVVGSVTGSKATPASKPAAKPAASNTAAAKSTAAKTTTTK
jgi:hypothetical protein